MCSKRFLSKRFLQRDFFQRGFFQKKIFKIEFLPGQPQFWKSHIITIIIVACHSILRGKTTVHSFIISHLLEWLKVRQIKSGIRVNFDQCEWGQQGNSNRNYGGVPPPANFHGSSSNYGSGVNKQGYSTINSISAGMPGNFQPEKTSSKKPTKNGAAMTSDFLTFSAKTHIRL